MSEKLQEVTKNLIEASDRKQDFYKIVASIEKFLGHTAGDLSENDYFKADLFDLFDKYR